MDDKDVTIATNCKRKASVIKIYQIHDPRSCQDCDTTYFNLTFPESFDLNKKLERNIHPGSDCFACVTEFNY